MRLSTPELNALLAKHKLALEGKKGGTLLDLSNGQLSKGSLPQADLTRASLKNADLTGCDLSGAKLNQADLSNANLFGANLSGANLTGANLTGAILTKAVLTNAVLTGTVLQGKTIVNFKAGKHDACYLGDNQIRIGCLVKTIAEWLAQYVELGKKHHYSTDQIAKYGAFIQECLTRSQAK